MLIPLRGHNISRVVIVPGTTIGSSGEIPPSPLNSSTCNILRLFSELLRACAAEFSSAFCGAICFSCFLLLLAARF